MNCFRSAGRLETRLRRSPLPGWANSSSAACRRRSSSRGTSAIATCTLQREIEEGLSLIEAWNRVNGVIFYGKSGEFATNRRDQQEIGMLSLHILQAALVYVNTLMIQDILAEPEWAGFSPPKTSVA